jgi:hypothetical protein
VKQRPSVLGAWHPVAMKIRAAVIGMLLCGGLASADPAPATPPPGPPQAALDACAKSKLGDPCTFTGRHGHDIKGTCATPHRKNITGLVCRGAHGPNVAPPAPPPAK